MIDTKTRVWFGHVKGFNHKTTLDYFNKRTWHLGNYNRLLNPPKWIQADTNSGIQLAAGGLELKFLELKKPRRASCKLDLQGSQKWAHAYPSWAF